MTDQEINIAIAESVGYRLTHSKSPGDFLLKSPQGECIGSVFTGKDSEESAWSKLWVNLPRYCSDLNAMNEAEKCLKEQGVKERYVGALGLIVEAEESKHECWEIGATTMLMLYCVAHATARQRAEAYLKTIGKWRD